MKDALCWCASYSPRCGRRLRTASDHRGVGKHLSLPKTKFWVRWHFGNYWRSLISSFKATLKVLIELALNILVLVIFLADEHVYIQIRRILRDITDFILWYWTTSWQLVHYTTQVFELEIPRHLSFACIPYINIQRIVNITITLVKNLS